jgi:N-acetylmuramoyl-L-alanine amidase
MIMQSYSAILRRQGLYVARLLLLASACLFVQSLPAIAATPVKIIVGGKEAPFEVSPYVNDGGTVMAPVDFVRLLGADYNVDGSGIVTITSASGHSFKQSYEPYDGRLMVPLLVTADELGAATTWSPATKTVTLQAKLVVAEVQGGNLIIVTSYPVYYKTISVDDPARLVVDIYGADLDSPPASIPADSPMVTHIRTGQLNPQTVRLVLDLTHPVHFQVSSTLQTKEIRLALGTSFTSTAPISSVVAQPAIRPALVPIANVPTQKQNAAAPPGFVLLPSLRDSSPQAGAPTKITDVEYKTDSPDSYQVVVTTAGPVDQATTAFHSFFLDHPNRLAFDVPNSVLDLASSALSSVTSLVPGVNPFLKSIRWGMVNSPQSSNGRIVIDLLKPVAYSVATETLSDNSGVQYTITIQNRAEPIPYGTSGGSIAGKIVVVDAGHGGKDPGAPGKGGICEKNFTLAIAKQIRDALIAAGATPIMTRSDDTFIPLGQRSQIGIDNHADFFLSIHCDSSGAQNARSGDTVYYHGNNATCRAFARSIANRLAQLDIAIQSDGIKSDYNRFPGGGFSVLRKSPEPAVLVECGYVDDDSDVKCLEDPNGQEQLATGIVAGLRDFVANQ